MTNLYLLYWVNAARQMMSKKNHNFFNDKTIKLRRKKDNMLCLWQSLQVGNVHLQCTLTRPPQSRMTSTSLRKMDPFVRCQYCHFKVNISFSHHTWSRIDQRLILHWIKISSVNFTYKSNLSIWCMNSFLKNI